MGNSGWLDPARGEAVWGGCLRGHCLLDFIILSRFQAACTKAISRPRVHSTLQRHIIGARGRKHLRPTDARVQSHAQPDRIRYAPKCLALRAGSPLRDPSHARPRTRAGMYGFPFPLDPAALRASRISHARAERISRPTLHPTGEARRPHFQLGPAV